MNKLKVKTKIECNTCGCSLARTKTIKVFAKDKANAVKEAEAKLDAWKQSLNGQNCAVCASIIESLNYELG